MQETRGSKIEKECQEREKRGRKERVHIEPREVGVWFRK